MLAWLISCGRQMPLGILIAGTQFQSLLLSPMFKQMPTEIVRYRLSGDVPVVISGEKMSSVVLD